jgi:transposase-like protein
MRAGINQLAAEAVRGDTLAEMAARHGMSRSDVYRRIARLGHGLPRRRAIRLTVQQIATLEELCTERVLTKTEIAREAGCSKQTAARWVELLDPDSDLDDPGEPYRCGTCGNRVERSPCPICQARGLVSLTPPRLPAPSRAKAPLRRVQMFLFD